MECFARIATTDSNSAAMMVLSINLLLYLVRLRLGERVGRGGNGNVEVGDRTTKDRSARVLDELLRLQSRSWRYIDPVLSDERKSP